MTFHKTITALCVALCTLTVRAEANPLLSLFETSPAPNAATGSEDATIRQALETVRAGKIAEAEALANRVQDPVGRKLIEWMILRNENASPDYARLMNFIQSNPGWPSMGFLRKKAEGALLDDNASLTTIKAHFARTAPTSTKGGMALAQARLAGGDQAGAAQLIRRIWREDAMSQALEQKLLERFGVLLTRQEHRQRLTARFAAEDDSGMQRAAARLGGGYVALGKALAAVDDKRPNAKALLDGVPADLKKEPAWILGASQWLRRNDKFREAAAVMAQAPHDAASLGDPEPWWTERRLLARKLMDIGEHRLAYAVVRDSHGLSGPEKIDQEFHAGWIALRFLKDPATANAHFTTMTKHAETPISVSRAHYWLGRTATASGDTASARRQYETAARHTTSYYGQLARAELGMNDLPLRQSPAPTSTERIKVQNSEPVRAIMMLYALGLKEMALPMWADFASRPLPAGELAALVEVAQRNKDARAVLTLGKAAIHRGQPFDTAAYPTFGIPAFEPVQGSSEIPLVYAIARQESTFDPRIVSSAGAKGLMQFMPATARTTAKNAGLPFQENWLISDPSYAAKLGAFHLGELLADTRGSYILAFVSYNAGPRRAAEWIAAYGDPRAPNVDAVDWVERIPFYETRNYVQRVMENLQVYRVLLGQRQGHTIAADLKKGG